MNPQVFLMLISISASHCSTIDIEMEIKQQTGILQSK
jgi:hypothetical protein